jgi:hypothetical protein
MKGKKNLEMPKNYLLGKNWKENSRGLSVGRNLSVPRILNPWKNDFNCSRY